jgi:ubiquinone/menaquinone biosynthesis C-methylase UbiE
MKQRYAQWIWLALAFVCVATAEEQSVRPGINKAYERPDVAQWVATFEQPGREVYDKRQEIVAASGVRPGMAIADIGAGTGLFTRLFAREVGSTGKVFAVDITRPFIDHILKTSREQGLTNVQGIVSSPADVQLPPASVDLAFICDTYHHFEYPQTILRTIYQALRPGGTLVVVDYRREPGMSSQWILGHVRAGKEAVIREIQQAGFTLIEDRPFLRENYFLRFKRI